MTRIFALLGLLGIVLTVVACGGASGSAPSGDSGNSSYNTKFPLPSSVSNFTATGDSAINFQTKVGLSDTIAFYRGEFAKRGLTERTINTSITDTTFSLVFDGDPSGKAIVVQGVDLGNGSTNVNIRYEDV
ncbi:MAG TPA: hypothetical protein VFH29_10125 [Anaerolineales bacterium]|nr:hypothetical protein [Anaerolineales bacterium]